MRNLVRDGKSAQLRNMISTGGNVGMQTLETSLADLVHSGQVELEDAMGATLYPKELEQRLGDLNAGIDQGRSP